MRNMKIAVAVLATAVISSGCALLHPHDYSGRGAMMGATAGAVIGHQYGNGGRDKGALIGGVLGYTAGLFYDQQERQTNSGHHDSRYSPRVRPDHGPGHQNMGYPGGYYYPPPQGYYYAPRR